MPQRIMAFVDGNYLLSRFEKLQANGRQPNSNVYWVRKEYVWHSSTFDPAPYAAIRTTYYRDAMRSSRLQEEVAARIHELKFSVGPGGASSYPNFLTPHILGDNGRRNKDSHVGIQIAVDVLSNVYRDNVEAIAIVSGDASYLPLIKEVQRSGKHVYVSAFGDDVGNQVVLSADKFLDLEPVYFRPQRRSDSEP